MADELKSRLSKYFDAHKKSKMANEAQEAPDKFLARVSKEKIELAEKCKSQILDGTFDVSSLPDVIEDSGMLMESPNPFHEMLNDEEVAANLYQLVADYYGTDKVYVGDLALKAGEVCPYEIVIGDIESKSREPLVLPETQIVFGSVEGILDADKSALKYVGNVNIGDSKTTGDIRYARGLWVQRTDDSVQDTLDVKNTEYVEMFHYLSSKLTNTDNLKYCGNLGGVEVGDINADDETIEARRQEALSNELYCKMFNLTEDDIKQRISREHYQEMLKAYALNESDYENLSSAMSAEPSNANYKKDLVEDIRKDVFAKSKQSGLSF